MKSNDTACISLNRLAGYIPDRSTPFDENGVTDLATFAKLCEYKRHPGDCDPERLQSPRYLQSQLAPLMASLARETPAPPKYAVCLLGLMRPDARLQIVELADSSKPRSRSRQGTRFQSDAAAT